MKRYYLVIILIITYLALALSACNAAINMQTKADTPSSVPPSPVPTLPPEIQAVYTAWESGVHANTYGVEKGSNTYCAKCHSPTNWDTAAKVDPPPNCVSCKFAFESEPRAAINNVLVPESDWNNIGCEICHKTQGEIVENAYGWLNTATGYHETVATSTQLCEKCHLDNETLRHKRDLGQGKMSNFECTKCHDAHSVKANCRNCHSDVLMTEKPQANLTHPPSRSNEDCLRCHPQSWDDHDRTIKEAGNDDCSSCHKELLIIDEAYLMQIAHSVNHITVTCVACHDASGLAVGPVEGQEVWMPFRTVQLLGRENTTPYQSHNLQAYVDCGRCHYMNNPWNLTTDITATK